MRERMIPGKRYIVTVEGVADSSGSRLITDGGRVVLSNDMATKRRLPDPAPKWLPGDVVVLRFPGNPTPYTYVRGARDWPGDRRFPKTDAQMDEHFRKGELTPVLQSGGEPFDLSRIPEGSRSDVAVETLRRRLSASPVRPTDRFSVDRYGRKYPR